MTPVGAYLKKLLYQYNCIVVPELGAFLTHYLPAAYQEGSGQYLPPRKRLAFNEALRLDDGILTNYLMLHEGIARDEALRVIGQFVAEVKQAAAQPGGYGLAGVGLITRNAEGRLEFDPELRHNFYGESFGMQPVAVQPWSVPAPEPVLVRSTDDEVLEAEELEPELPPVPRRSPWRWAAAALLVGSLGAVSYLTVMQSARPLQSSLNPASLLRLPPWERPATPARAATTLPEPALARPAAPVPNASVSAPTASPTTFRAGAATTLPKPAVAAAAVNPASAPRGRRVVIEALAKPTVRTALLPRYSVVAGSFARRQNAVRLQYRLRQAGYADAYMIRPRKPGELIKVVALGTADKPEALAAIGRLTDMTGMQAWIMKRGY